MNSRFLSGVGRFVICALYLGTVTVAVVSAQGNFGVDDAVAAVLLQDAAPPCVVQPVPPCVVRPTMPGVVRPIMPGVVRPMMRPDALRPKLQNFVQPKPKPKPKPIPALIPVPNTPQSEADAASDDDHLLGSQGTVPLTRELKPADYQDWREAGGGEERLGSRLRTHVVRLQKDGSLSGRISLINVNGGLIPISQIVIRFVREGVTKSEFQPNADGTFQVKGLTEGAYGMVADGPEGFVAWSVFVNPPFDDRQVHRESDQKFVAFQVEKSDLAVSATAVPPADFAQVGQLIQGYAQSRDKNRYMEPQDSDIPANAGAKGGDHQADDNEVGNPIMRDVNDAQAATTVQHHKIFLRADGTLRGRIRRLHNQSGRPLSIRRLNVFFVRGDTIVAQIPVDRRGTFEVSGLNPDVYSVVAAGRDGFLAFSLQVMAHRLANARPELDSEIRFAAQIDGDAGLELACDGALVSYENVGREDLNRYAGSLLQAANGEPPLLADLKNDAAVAGTAPPRAVGAGGFGGSGPVRFGGGAGPIGGGGGGIGEILAAGLLIGFGAAEISDGDGIRVASPAIP